MWKDHYILSISDIRQKPRIIHGFTGSPCRGPLLGSVFSLDSSGECLLQRREWEEDGEGESGRGREKELVGEEAGLGDYNRDKDTGCKGKE